MTKARFAALVLGLCLGLGSGCGAVHAQGAATDDLARLVNWLGGEWNNNEQVWQQKLDAADPKVTRKPDALPHLHHIVTPVAVPQLGYQVLYVQQSQGADLAQDQQRRLLRLTQNNADGSIRQQTFSLPDRPEFANAQLRADALAALPLTELSATPGCDVLWRFDAAAQAYIGSMVAAGCKESALRPGQALIASSSQKLTADQWLAGDLPRDATGALVPGSDSALRSRKARYYEGWVWFKLAGPGAAADDKNTSFTARYLLHNEGQRLVVMQQDGMPSPYVLELALLTYQNTRRPILKFALLDRQSGKTLTYIWGSPDAPTLGMNLQWFQAGVTLKPVRPNFGF